MTPTSVKIKHLKDAAANPLSQPARADIAFQARGFEIDAMIGEAVAESGFVHRVEVVHSVLFPDYTHAEPSLRHEQGFSESRQDKTSIDELKIIIETAKMNHDRSLVLSAIALRGAITDNPELQVLFDEIAGVHIPTTEEAFGKVWHPSNLLEVYQRYPEQMIQYARREAGRLTLMRLGIAGTVSNVRSSASHLLAA